MSAAEKVECFHCGKKVRVLADGTYAKHGWTRHGVKHDCERSGEIHNRHSGSFRCVGPSRRWLCECLCGDTFLADTYDEVDQQWVAHGEAAKAAVTS